MTPFHDKNVRMQEFLLVQLLQAENKKPKFWLFIPNFGKYFITKMQVKMKILVNLIIRSVIEKVTTVT